MVSRMLILVVLFAGLLSAQADDISTAIDQTLVKLDARVSKEPYSRVIKRMYIGYNEQGESETGIALREIESFASITAIVIVDQTADGFTLREVLIPDIKKMRKPDERKQVLKLLERFRNVPFDPYSEHSAVDTVSGATKYSIKMTSYLNYLARHTALEMQKKPDWPKK